MKSIRLIFATFIIAILAGIFISGTVKVMPVGDSLTEASAPGYRGYLFQMLKDSGLTVDFVGGNSNMPSEPLNTDANHSGFGGYVIGPDSSVLDQYYGGKGTASINWELDHHKQIMSKGAEVIILMIGTNDFGNNRNAAYSPSRDGAIRLDSLVEKIYRFSPNVKLLLSNITPTQSNLSGSLFSKFNDDVPLIVAKQKAKGRACYFVNNCKNDFIYADYADVVHFKATGYQKLAKNFFTIIAPVLREMGAVSNNNEVCFPKVVLFPNPATNTITIKNTVGKVSIVNLLGRTITSNANYQGEAISLNGYSSGTYFVRTANGVTPFVKL